MLPKYTIISLKRSKLKILILNTLFLTLEAFFFCLFACFRPSDVGLTAVASNNLVCINKDQNVFDSRKRIKVATAVESEAKLNSFQRKLIAFNEILFYIITNQVSRSKNKRKRKE
jgi:hypothetical protein